LHGLVIGGRLFIIHLDSGNGGQPILVARGPDYAKGPHVHTHYHGNNATVADPLGSKAGMNARIRDVLLSEDRQAVFVLPEDVNAGPHPDSPREGIDYGVSWTNAISQVQTTQDALEAAGVTQAPEQTVVSFHSGGGLALDRLILADPCGGRLKADRVELYDCVYHFGSTKDKQQPVYYT
jgi:hypothetical protein